MQIKCQTELAEGDLEQWCNFLENAKHQHPRQHPNFAEEERAYGRLVIFAMGYTDGALKAIGLFSFRPHPFVPSQFAEAVCSSGPVVDDPETLAQFLDNVSQHTMFRRAGRLAVTPYWLDSEAEQLDIALKARNWVVSDSDRFRKTGWVNLRPSTTDIQASFSTSARREIRRAVRQGIVVRPITEICEAIEFWESLNRLRSDRRLELMPKSNFLASFENVLSRGDIGIIIGAFHSQSFVGGLLLARGKYVAHGAHFTTEPRILKTLGNLRISPILWFEGMTWARDKGCLELDVEGYREVSDKSDPGYSVNKYKSEFQPKTVVRISERSRVSNHSLAATASAYELARFAYRSMKLRIRQNKS